MLSVRKPSAFGEDSMNAIERVTMNDVSDELVLGRSVVLYSSIRRLAWFAFLNNPLPSEAKFPERQARHCSQGSVQLSDRQSLQARQSILQK